MRRPIAAIDIGSNSVHLTLARVDADERIEILHRHKESVRLAGALQRDGRLSEVAMRRVLETLVRFRYVADTHDAVVRATGTAAVRAARNRGELLARAHADARVPIEVISGAEEARLTYLGVLHGLPELRERRILCVDVGGGSTELLVGECGRPRLTASVPHGALLVSRRLLGADPVGRKRVSAARRRLAQDFAERLADVRTAGFTRAVATAGSIQRIARIARALEAGGAGRNVNGQQLSRAALEKVIGCLVSAEVQARRLLIPGIDPDRADTLLGGALVFETLTRGLGIESWTVSTAALRTGLLLDTSRQSDE